MARPSIRIFMNIPMLLLFFTHSLFSQVNLQQRETSSKKTSSSKKSPKKASHKNGSVSEVQELKLSSQKLDQFILKYRDRPAIWDFTSSYDFKTASVLRGRLLNSIVSTNLQSPLVIEVHSEQGLPEGTILSCLGMTKFKRVVAGCSRLITPGASGVE